MIFYFIKQVELGWQLYIQDLGQLFLYENFIPINAGKLFYLRYPFEFMGKMSNVLPIHWRYVKTNTIKTMAKIV